MVTSHGFGYAFRIAFNISMFSWTYGMAWQNFSRLPWNFTREKGEEIMKVVWGRAERVKYYRDTPSNRPITIKKLCGERPGNIVFITTKVNFIDDDGNNHEQYIHVKTPRTKFMGQLKEDVMNEIVRQLIEREYFGGDYSNARRSIVGNEIQEVRCLSGSDY